MLQYAYTILYVADVEASIQFYETAFGLTRKLLTPEKDYGELETGNTRIAFASVALASSNLDQGFQTSSLEKPSFGIELAFTTTELESAVSQAQQAGAVLLQPIAHKPWGQQVAYLRDCNGFLIELCTPMGG